MTRNEILAEIKKLLQEELQAYAKPLSDQIPPEYKQQAVDIQEDVRAMVKEHPLISIGLALTAGFIIARALYRRED